MIRHKIQALVLGLGIAFCATVGLSASAYATSTCYTGCEPTTPSSSPPPVVTTSHSPSTSSSSALAFTGADIEGMVAIGGGALMGGGLLVFGGRRHRAAKQ